MRRAALTRGERPKDQLRVRSYAVSAGRSIAGTYPLRSTGATSEFPNAYGAPFQREGARSGVERPALNGWNRTRNRSFDLSPRVSAAIRILQERSRAATGIARAAQMPFDATFVVLAVLSGSVVGFILGLIGSGGSILALPLLVYVVGYEGEPHAAIGTAALAVSASAFASVLQHRAHGTVRFRTGLLFAAPGVLGTLAGAELGLRTPGERLLFLFAAVMLLAAAFMWRGPGAASASPERPRGREWLKAALELVPVGFAVGTLAGFFGIGGGFLIVPALVWAARFDVKTAIGTSLVAVTAFGLSTALRYGAAGKLDFPVAGLFVLGGVAGGVVGTILSRRTPRETLRRAFAGVLVAVAGYMLVRNAAAVPW